MKDSTLVKLWIAAVFLSAGIFLTALVTTYVGVDCTSPSVNEESVPPPKPLR